MDFARAQPILRADPDYHRSALEDEAIPRVMAPVSTLRYSAESFMRRGAFDLRENLRCKSCRG
jgi:hypothetical protein